MEAKTARILDGKALAQKIQSELSDRVRALQPQKGRPPGLAVLMVGDNPVRDGGAVAVGCRAFVLPSEYRDGERGLTAVLGLL